MIFTFSVTLVMVLSRLVLTIQISHSTLDNRGVEMMSGKTYKAGSTDAPTVKPMIPDGLEERQGDPVTTPVDGGGVTHME
jgi:hypothetical protein